jgi:UDP-glucose 4-epimerase
MRKSSGLILNKYISGNNNIFIVPESVRLWLQAQKIVVTGGSGAVGRRLIRRLVDAGAKNIISYDLAPIHPDYLYQTPGLCIEQIQGDILDLEKSKKVFQDCTVLFHLAALINVRDSLLDPIHYFHINSLGTAYVLEASRRSGIKNIIYTSTCHVYGKPLQLPVTEDHRTQPISMYAATKLAGEATVQGYAASYGATCHIARLSNLYGASFEPATAFSLAITQALSGDAISLRNLQSIRDFIHVDDVLQALIRLATLSDSQALSGTHIVNLSTGTGTSLYKIAEILAETAAKFGLPKPAIRQAQEDPPELIPELIIDNSCLTGMTGWTPGISVEEGITIAASEFLGLKDRKVLR